MTSPAEQFAQTKRANAAFFFPERGTWSDGVTRSFKLADLNRLTTTGPARLVEDPMPASLRLVKFHPDDPLPKTGAAVQARDGFFVLGLFTDQGNLFRTRVGVGRLVDERVYPLTATIGTQGFRLRIEALDTQALRATDLSLSSNDSHRGYLPPGVHLQPGEVITIMDGDQYRVVPPVQRDTLGDTVGLSWQARAEDRTPTEGNDPTPLPAPSPQPPAPAGYDPAWDDPV